MSKVYDVLSRSPATAPSGQPELRCRSCGGPLEVPTLALHDEDGVTTWQGIALCDCATRGPRYYTEDECQD